MTRPTNPADPTAEGTSEQSTQTSSGLTGGRPADDRAGRGHQEREEEEDVPIARTPGERATTPRRYEREADDPTMPADDASLNTKI